MTLPAQQPAAAAPQPEVFDVRTRLVLVPVTVTSSSGKVGRNSHVSGLNSSDFQLLDNGRPVPVTVDSIGTGVAPIALAIAVQSSGISAAVVEKIHKIGSMIRPLVLGERGSAAVLMFDDTVRWTQRDWTSDESRISAALATIEANLGSTGRNKQARMLDAAIEAIAHLYSTRRSSRRILLLISESRDRNSETDLNQVAYAAQQAGVVVYAAQYSAFRTGFTRRSSQSAGAAPRDQSGRPNPEHSTPSGAPPKDKYDPRLPPPAQRVDILGALGELGRFGKEKATEILARDTGGLVFSFARQKGLEEAVEKIGADLHAQYVLSFVPPAPVEPGYHRLEVRLTRPSGKDGSPPTIRARPGYWVD